MKIAVITPTLLSRANLLDECKKSVQKQQVSVPVFHAIAVDTNKVGSAITRNKIVSNLPPDFDWIAFLDDDDLFLPDHLQSLIDASQNADIVYSNVRTVGFTWDLVIGEFDRNRLAQENFIPVTVLMRRSLFEKVGGFPDCWVEDHDLWKRCLAVGARFVYVPKVTWLYRQLPNHTRKTMNHGRNLIAITSCVKDALDGTNQAMRDTFLKDISQFSGLDYRFFIGDSTPTGEDETALRASFEVPAAQPYRQKYPIPLVNSILSYTPKEDEIVLHHVPDGYLHTSFKTRESHRWGMQHGFESHIFQCFTDTYIDLHRLAESGFQDYDYSGCSAGQYASGGSGYWLSNRASRFILDEAVTDWAEDRWVGSIMKKNRIPLHVDPRYRGYPETPQNTSGCITSHLAVTPKVYDSKLMYEVHADRHALIAIVTCKQNGTRRQALLDTWIPAARAAGYDVEFFDGERLGVPDDYAHLPLKAKAIFKWAWNHDYNRLLKVDDDTYIKVDQLKIVDFDYAGIRWPANDMGSTRCDPPIPDFPPRTFPHDYITGGAVWFSRKAIEILVKTPLNKDYADDRWVGHTLARAGISLTQLSNFDWYPSNGHTVLINVPTPEALQILHKNPESEPSRLLSSNPPSKPRANFVEVVVIGGRHIWVPKPRRG